MFFVSCRDPTVAGCGKASLGTALGGGLEEQHRERGQRHGQRVRSIVGRNGLSREAAEISKAGAAIHGRVAVQQFFPIAALWDTDAILQPWDWRKITDDGDVLLWCPAVSQETDDPGIHVLAVDPLEPSRVEIEFMQRRLCPVEMIQIGDPPFQPLMRLVLEQVPIDAVVVGPFAPLADFTTHENQFFCSLGVHIAEQRTEVGLSLIHISEPTRPY